MESVGRLEPGIGECVRQPRRSFGHLRPYPEDNQGDTKQGACVVQECRSANAKVVPLHEAAESSADLWHHVGPGARQSRECVSNGSERAGVVQALCIVRQPAI